MSKNSVSLHRVLKATPEKIYRAYTDGNALACCPVGDLAANTLAQTSRDFFQVKKNSILLN